MKKRMMVVLLFLIAIVMLCFGLTACGKQGEHVHSYGSWVSDGETMHSRQCLCGDTERQNHDFSGNICSVCGYEKSSGGNDNPTPHTHNYGAWMSDGSETHTRECSCGESETQNHTFNGDTCSRCGYKKTSPEQPVVHTHNYASAWSSDENNHWHVCISTNGTCDAPKKDISTHSWNNGVITTEATAERDGVKTYTCTVCNKTKTESVAFVPPTHTHSYESGWTYDDTYHWHACTAGDCDSTSGIATHTYDAGTITTQPTASSDGVRTYTCTVCNKTKTEVVTYVPPTHTHNLVSTAVKFATCTEDGNIAYWLCSGCNKYFSDSEGKNEITQAQTILVKTGHTPTDWIIDSNATCTEDGAKHKECTVCEATIETATITKTGHTEQVIKGTPATCTEDGLTDGIKCSVCQTILTPQTTISATGHNVVDGECTNCDYVSAPATIRSITGGTINQDDKTIYMVVSYDTEFVTIYDKITIGTKDTWSMYWNMACTQEIVSQTAIPKDKDELDNGDNKFYILVREKDGSIRNLYTLTIYRSFAVDVKFYDGNTLLKTETAYTGYEFTTDYVPVITGYTFNKWKNSDESDFVPIVLKEALNIYADTTVNKYRATFVTDSKTTPVDETQYTYDSSVTLPIPVKTGYTFDGWNDGTNIISSTFVWKYADDVEFVASFTANTYTITYIPDGGTIDGGNTQTVTFDEEFTLRTATRTGYDFVNYTYEDEVFTSGTFTFTNDIIITANWNMATYTITYVVTNGTNDPNNPVTFTIDDLPVSLSPCIADDENYSHWGWYTADNENIVVSQITAVGNITLFDFIEHGTQGLSYVQSGGNYQVSGYDGIFTSVVIPSTHLGKSVTEIQSNALTNKTSIVSLVVPDSVTSISMGTLSGCSSLESITLPFVGERIRRPSDSFQYPFGRIFGTTSYTGGKKIEQFYYGSSTTKTTSSNYYIPSSLKSVIITGGNILYFAFGNCSNLTNIIIPNDLTDIGKSAFSGCSSLTSITIPDGVTSIDESVFNGCTSLTSVSI